MRFLGSCSQKEKSHFIDSLSGCFRWRKSLKYYISEQIYVATSEFY